MYTRKTTKHPSLPLFQAWAKKLKISSRRTTNCWPPSKTHAPIFVLCFYFANALETNNTIPCPACRNALNIVKDDLIVKVDELTGEIEILRDEMNSISSSRNKLRDKLGELEDELRRTKDQVKQQGTLRLFLLATYILSIICTYYFGSS